jgi:serine/threonine-protein kinase
MTRRDGPFVRTWGDAAVDELLELVKDALVDRYAIERPIGRGGMATVYLAQELHPPRQVAIKVMDPALSSRMGRERFLREVEIACQLTHPHIVPIFAAGKVDELLYYVMPFIAGESLRVRLNHHAPLPLDEAVRIARHVAEALAYAHSLNVIHRDIKPANILFEHEHAVVTDFGIARAISAAGKEHLTETGLSVGTPAYMSPEQAVGSRGVDSRSDIYSLACVVHEMLSGGPPSAAINYIDATEAPHPASLSGSDGDAIPRAVLPVLGKALAWSPEDRYRSATEFAAALAETATEHAVAVASRCTSAAGQGVSEKSIAVLPLTNMSADPANDYFSDGITDDIITQLSKIEGLKVISRTSAMRYRKSSKSLREIGEELGVATVLEGSVRHAGDRVRITSQLIDVQTDGHLWAETYDRDLTDIFQIQSDVAGQIASALQTTLSPVTMERIGRKPTEDIEAYGLYLRGRYYWNKCTPESARKALGCFEQAIERDSEFALAYAGLANAYWTLGIMPDDSPLPPTDAFLSAKEAAQRALQIEPALSDALATLGSVHFWYEWDWRAAEAAFARATECSTCCEEPHIKYGFYLAAMKRHREAIDRVRNALKLDPVSPSVNGTLAWQYYWASEFDRAAEQALSTLELDAASVPARLCLGLVHLHLGRVQHAIDHLEGAICLTGRMPNCVSVLGCAYAAAGRTDDARAALGEMQALSDIMYVSPRSIAVVHAWLGEVDGALDWLERAYSERAAWMSFLNVDPMWTPLRAEPRFQTVVREMGFPRTRADQRLR